MAYISQELTKFALNLEKLSKDRFFAAQNGITSDQRTFRAAILGRQFKNCSAKCRVTLKI
jgi:hypothetical protein